MSMPCSMSRRCTFLPSGPVWCVTRFMPKIARALSCASAKSLATLTPPPLPRPPAWICALTTTTSLPGLLLHLADGVVDLAEVHDGAADGNGHAVALEQLLALILVNLHGLSPPRQPRNTRGAQSQAVCRTMTEMRVSFLLALVPRARARRRLDAAASRARRVRRRCSSTEVERRQGHRRSRRRASRDARAEPFRRRRRTR